MAYEVVWTHRARRDLRSLVLYIARDKPLVAESFRQQILEKVERLPEFPEMGRVVPERQDPHNAAFILGQIRNPRAVEPLIGALKDEYWSGEEHGCKFLGCDEGFTRGRAADSCPERSKLEHSNWERSSLSRVEPDNQIRSCCENQWRFLREQRLVAVYFLGHAGTFDSLRDFLCFEYT